MFPRASLHEKEIKFSKIVTAKVPLHSSAQSRKVLIEKLLFCSRTSVLARCRSPAQTIGASVERRVVPNNWKQEFLSRFLSSSFCVELVLRSMKDDSRKTNLLRRVFPIPGIAHERWVIVEQMWSNESEKLIARRFNNQTWDQRWIRLKLDWRVCCHHPRWGANYHLGYFVDECWLSDNVASSYALAGDLQIESINIWLRSDTNKSSQSARRFYDKRLDIGGFYKVLWVNTRSPCSLSVGIIFYL